TQAGYPVGALKLMDEINMKLSLKIADEFKKAAEKEGTELKRHAALDVMDKMVNELKRPGKLDGAGFYEYDANGKGHIWPGLADVFGDKTELPFHDMQDRMLFSSGVETVKFRIEGLLTSFGGGNVSYVVVS